VKGDGGKGTQNKNGKIKKLCNNLAWKLDVRKRVGRSERQKVIKIYLKE